MSKQSEDFIEAMIRLGHPIISKERDAKFDVIVDGKIVTRLNSSLANHQKCTDEEIELIKGLHSIKYLNIQSAKNHLDNGVVLRALSKIDTQIEFALQRVWHFPLDQNFHRFWHFPGCTCPKMDNEDAYPHGYYTKAMDCPVHVEKS